jgi:hypothetical protein
LRPTVATCPYTGGSQLRRVRGLFLAGFVDAPGGLLPVVETQGQWIAAVLTGRLRLPPPEQMD